MKKYARIYNESVVEFFETDDDITQMFHPDFIWVDITDMTEPPAEGWAAAESDGTWAFSAPEVVPPTLEELKASALAQRDALLAAANESTAGMADAYIAGLLDEADTATFKAYATYKLALNKINTQPGYPATIKWPTFP